MAPRTLLCSSSKTGLEARRPRPATAAGTWPLFQQAVKLHIHTAEILQVHMPIVSTNHGTAETPQQVRTTIVSTKLQNTQTPPKANHHCLKPHGKAHPTCRCASCKHPPTHCTVQTPTRTRATPTHDSLPNTVAKSSMELTFAFVFALQIPEKSPHNAPAGSQIQHISRHAQTDSGGRSLVLRLCAICSQEQVLQRCGMWWAVGGGREPGMV